MEARREHVHFFCDVKSDMSRNKTIHTAWQPMKKEKNFSFSSPKGYHHRRITLFLLPTADKYTGILHVQAVAAESLAFIFNLDRGLAKV